jgi:hypothetical protein
MALLRMRRKLLRCVASRMEGKESTHE